MYSPVTFFDPREIIVLGFATTTLGQLKDAPEIDVKVRGANPLDDVIEPEIGRKFAALVAEGDFSAAGDIPYCPPMTGGKETGKAEFAKTLQDLQALFAAAGKRRDALNEERKKRCAGGSHLPSLSRSRPAPGAAPRDPARPAASAGRLSPPRGRYLRFLSSCSRSPGHVRMPGSRYEVLKYPAYQGKKRLGKR